MRYGIRAGSVLAVALLTGAALLAQPGVAWSAPAGGLDVAVRGTDPLAAALVLTNRGTAPCQVVASSFATVAVT